MQPSVANATNIDTLLANKEGIECVKVPPENLQDKVFFIFNNLSMSNMDSKVCLTFLNALVDGSFVCKLVGVGYRLQGETAWFHEHIDA